MDLQTSSSALAGFRILVVEDEPILALETHDRLVAHGAEVIGPCPSVDAALAEIAGEPPDAAVLDVNLRGVWSTPVAEALRTTGVPLILMTGYDRRHLEHFAFRSAPILSKPATAGELVRAVRGLLVPDEWRGQLRPSSAAGAHGARLTA